MLACQSGVCLTTLAWQSGDCLTTLAWQSGVCLTTLAWQSGVCFTNLTDKRMTCFTLQDKNNIRTFSGSIHFICTRFGIGEKTSHISKARTNKYYIGTYVRTIFYIHVKSIFIYLYFTKDDTFVLEKK